MRLAVVCARQGSKEVPDKNRWLFQGRPLVAHAVCSAKDTRIFDAIVVSSDSDDLLNLAREAGADILVGRPADLATDSAPKLDAIRHAVEMAEASLGRQCDVVADLDVTTPLRQPADIVAAVACLDQPGINRVLTASPARRSPYFNQVEVNERGAPSLPCSDGVIVRRQDSPAVFDLSGAVYVWRRTALFQPGPLVQSDARLHVLPTERAWDIDSELDLVIVSALAGLLNSGEK